jgi:YegS/Rv2252/BmrU family lipid kinase
MPLKKIFIFANPKARGRNPEALDKAIELLRKEVELELITANSLEESTSLAAKLGEDPDNLIVPCGGDGTINSIVYKLPPNAVMGILPSGTANVVARELGIPLNLREAAKNLLTGAKKTIDLGMINKEKFVFVAGLGFDALSASTISKRLKTMIGKSAYGVSAIKNFLTYRPPIITVKTNDKIYEGRFCIIANMRRYGGELFWASKAKFDDGLLNMVLFKEWNTISLLKALISASQKKGVPDDIAFNLISHNFIINCSEQTPYQIDGEVFPSDQDFNVTIVPKALNIIIP